MVFALATVRINDQPTPIIRIDEKIYRLEDVAPGLLARQPGRGLVGIFDDWAANEATLIAEADKVAQGEHAAKPLDRVLTADDFLAPLLYPNKVVCFGANYYDHMHQDAKMPHYHRDNVVPVMFIKAPSTSVVGSGKSVRYPSHSEKFDWEIELGVVIGKPGRRVAAKDVPAIIAAYTICIDLTARDWQHHPKHLFNIDCFAGKSFDDSCPMGPWVVPARFVDAKNLNLRLSLNGELKQNGNTRDMVWSIEEVLEVMSKHVTLEPGDVVLTGTPGGVGARNDTFMKVGDKLLAEIEGLGTLEVEVMEDQDQPLRQVAHA